MAYDMRPKAPLKFPDQAVDQVMMISYMIDGQGFLITIVTSLVEESRISSIPQGRVRRTVTVFNEADEVCHLLVTSSPFDDRRSCDNPSILDTYELQT